MKSRLSRGLQLLLWLLLQELAISNEIPSLLSLAMASHVAPYKKMHIPSFTDQVGSDLTEFLIYKDYQVHGIIRRSSNFNILPLEHNCIDSHQSSFHMKLHDKDLLNVSALCKWVDSICPEEVYNLGAQSHTTDVVGTSTLRLLEAIESTSRPLADWTADLLTCKMTTILVTLLNLKTWRKAVQGLDDKTTVLHPRNSYAVAKVAGHFYTINYC
uniref:GDP-mannose 4,6-dehydratase n=1 Tax=Physcomitrium patens TaxID=3218 RepID=A0A2K1J2S7_PHYPA|nr:hypothetical protein PHYPA_021674 [Physcomitrium patens]